MKFINYFRESDEFMRSLLWCMDNALAAEKMYHWENIGNGNDAWVNGPFITSGINGSAISRDSPYILKISDYFSRLISYQYESEGKGTIAIGDSKNMIPPTQIVPTVAICMQFSLLEDYEFSEFDRYIDRENLVNDKKLSRYKKKPVRERLDILAAMKNTTIPKNIFNAYESLSNFRNLLTHEPDKLCNSPIVAIDYYVTCQAISFEINNIIGDEVFDSNVIRRKGFWKYQLDKFQEVLVFN